MLASAGSIPPSRPMSKSFARLIFGLTLAFFAAFFLWPILQILKGGFVDADGRLTFTYLAALLADPTYLTGLRNSVMLACATTTLAILIALPLAFVSDRFRFPGKPIFSSLILVPMILPPFVGAIGIRQIFGQYGALNALIIALGLEPMAGPLTGSGRTSSGGSRSSMPSRFIP